VRIGVLVSGGGRSAVNLAEAIRRDGIPAEIVAVVATRPTVPAIARCRAAGLPVAVVAVAEDPATFDDRLDAALEAAGVELVVLAGYLRRFRVGTRWTGHAINIHPALLPRHGGPGMFGEHVHRAVLAAGDAESGCTVHWVDEQYDHGGAIVQRRCPVEPGDTPETLAARVFAEERIALPEAVRSVAGGILAARAATIAP
jgi:formyltetrahydrofolate-dependent phosphoribosylglycinamide formyltransferase